MLVNIKPHFLHAGPNIEFNWDGGRWKHDGGRVGQAKSKVALARRPAVRVVVHSCPKVTCHVEVEVVAVQVQPVLY